MPGPEKTPSWLSRPVAPHRPEHDDPEIRDAKEKADSDARARKGQQEREAAGTS